MERYYHHPKAWAGSLRVKTRLDKDGDVKLKAPFMTGLQLILVLYNYFLIDKLSSTFGFHLLIKKKDLPQVITTEVIKCPERHGRTMT